MSIHIFFACLHCDKTIEIKPMLGKSVQLLYIATHHLPNTWQDLREPHSQIKGFEKFAFGPHFTADLSCCIKNPLRMAKVRPIISSSYFPSLTYRLCHPYFSTVFEPSCVCQWCNVRPVSNTFKVEDRACTDSSH